MLFWADMLLDSEAVKTEGKVLREADPSNAVMFE